MITQKMVIMNYSAGNVRVLQYDPESPVPKEHAHLDHSEYVFNKWCEDNGVRPQDCYYMTGKITVTFE